jgi:uncharacterized membrane protein YeaQ/YmgE (transglycosylase-associated protein family)
MAGLGDPAVTFIIVILIGILVGWLMQRMLRTSWLSKQIAGGNRVLVTSALVGIAGSFIGFHIASLIGLSSGGSIALFIGAAIGAAVVVWAWQTIRF